MMQRKLRFGVNVFQSLPWPTMAERWRTLEALGFDTGWVSDWIGGRIEGGRPKGLWFESFSLLSGLATLTSRLRLGVLVSSPVFRNPVLLARQAITLDHISDGRLRLGIGSGSQVPAAGFPSWPARERIIRFQEVVQLLDKLLTQDVTSYSGRYYQVSDVVRTVPPIQSPRPPLVVAGHGPRALMIVAQYAATWSSYANTMEELATGKGRSAEDSLEVTRARNGMLTDFATSLGRNPDDIGRAFAVGFTPDAPFASRDAFHDFVGRYRDAGIDEFILTWAGDDYQGRPHRFIQGKTMLESVATDWIPRLTK